MSSARGEASPPSGHHSAGSHNVRRHNRNKKSDPFLELSNDVNLTEQPIPRRPKGEDMDGGGDLDDQGDSILADVRETTLACCRHELCS